MVMCMHAECMPALPEDVLRNILELVAGRWRRRRVQTAKEEVREWTQYCLVSKEWQKAFQALPLCVVFDEVRPVAHCSKPYFVSVHQERRFVCLPPVSGHQGTARTLLGQGERSTRSTGMLSWSA